MAPEDINLLIAFVAGVLSFLSPCVLPLVPAYIGFLSGASLAEASRQRRTALTQAAGFVLGFGLVFTLLGASVGLIGYALYDALPLIRQVGGLLLIILGLQMVGILKIPALYQTRQFHYLPTGPMSYLTAILVGIFFAAGWTPCVGPVLAGILLLASTTQTVGQGAILLALYSLGLGLPFILAALALDRVSQYLKRLNRYGHLVEWISGGLLIIMGILLLTNLLARLSAYLNFDWKPPL